jgi:hypothetical protein
MNGQLWNPQSHYRVHNRPLDSAMNQLNQSVPLLRISKRSFLLLSFNLRLDLPRSSLQVFRLKCFMHVSSNPPLFDSPIIIFCEDSKLWKSSVFHPPVTPPPCIIYMSRKSAAKHRSVRVIYLGVLQEEGREGCTVLPSRITFFRCTHSTSSVHVFQWSIYSGSEFYLIGEFVLCWPFA